MAQTPKYPQNLPTADDWSTSNAGMGREKSNDKSPVDLNVNAVAEEFNQARQEIIAIAKKLGIDRTDLTDSSDTDYANSGEILSFMAQRADKPGFVEHFVNRSGIAHDSNYLLAAGTATTVWFSDAVGVKAQTIQVATDTGWATQDQPMRFRSTHVRFRWQVDTLVGSWANGDYMRLGLYNSVAPSFVDFYVARAAGSWPVWTVRIDDGIGGTASDTLTVAPSTGWHVFEIVTTATGATFYHDRGAGTADEDSKTLTQAPANDKADLILWTNEAAGGDVLRTDMISAQDKRIL